MIIRHYAIILIPGTIPYWAKSKMDGRIFLMFLVFSVILKKWPENNIASL